MIITFLPVADRQASMDFVDIMTGTRCSICPLGMQESSQWERNGHQDRSTVVEAIIPNVESRSDESLILHDASRNIVCLGRKEGSRWLLLPIEQPNRPSVDALLKLFGKPGV